MTDNSHLTLDDLENERWSEPELDSHLIVECHRLRKIPIGQFTTENLRIMIGQGFSLPHLMPLALAKLIDDPFAQGDFYAGDLLQVVLRTDWSFWENYPAVFAELHDVIAELENRIRFANTELLPVWQTYFRNS